MDFKKLDNLLDAEPKYRKKQVWHFVFEKLIKSWDEATSLPVGLREKLKKEIDLSIVNKITGAGDVKKALITFVDGQSIETVLMQHNDDRNTVCVSSQIGCAMGCKFCATGTMGLHRNLSSWEIVEQVLFFSRLLGEEGKRVTNVVVMGMGEPMMNYDEVIAAIRFLNNKDTFNLGARRFSVSTVGIVDGINQIREEDMDINLAVSLHFSDDKLRSRFMPVNKTWGITKLLDAIDDYIKEKKRRVMIEYVLIRGVNDNEENAERLVKLLKGKLCFVNLIVYNRTKLYSPPHKAVVDRFKEVLESGGLEVTQRHGFGNKIDAACGQLLIKKNGA